jgi:SAM-dependent methyltransferase
MADDQRGGGRLTSIDGGAGGAAPTSATFPGDADLPYDVVHYGPDLPSEAELRLLGNLEGKRVLDLGCGAGHAAVAMAKQGAKVIAVTDEAELALRAREAADHEETKVEVHQSDLAEIPFVRADTIDAVVSIYALAGTGDLDRVFRQAHRVLKTDMPIVLSLPHPAASMFDASGKDPLHLRRPYFESRPRQWTHRGRVGLEHTHTVSAVFTSLWRANFRVDTLLELEPTSGAVRSEYWTDLADWVPTTLLIRARKHGT